MILFVKGVFFCLFDYFFVFGFIHIALSGRLSADRPPRVSVCDVFLSVICHMTQTLHARVVENRNEGVILRIRPALLYLALGAPKDISNDTEQSERCMLGDVVFLFNLERGR